MNTKKIWACSDCGQAHAKWSGMCSTCKKWNTIVEELQVKDTHRFYQEESKQKPISITQIKKSKIQRQFSNIAEFDRLMGKGVVKGSLTLIGGSPGIGKSTLMLQMADSFAKQGLIVLYVCGEESKEQTYLRAERLGVMHQNLYLFSETLFSQVQKAIEELKPDILIIDSIQILYKSEIPSAPGSLVQVREITTQIMHICKRKNLSTFLIGHITKSGEIAGPKVLEHLVDTVLEFEGDKQHGFRLLRSIKNRFGPTDDIAIFQMAEKGLVQVTNPSMVFIEQREKPITGSVIVAALEGVRSFLIEVQALVSTTCFPTPSRKCTGLDQNRLSLLIAVLEKRMGYKLYNCDIFVSLAGGVKLKEPALDLGIVLAIASSFSMKIIPSDTLVIGEIGLGGEIRAVGRIEARLKEAVLMGYKKCLMPERNYKQVQESFSEKITIIPVRIIDEAVGILLG